MSFARLSDPDSAAIAVFPAPDNQLCIVVGNIAAAKAKAAHDFLREEAEDYFGEVKDSRSREGSVAGRRDVCVFVEAENEKVMAFVKERLGGSDNQIV